jgi:hypothetical protein
MYKTIVDRLQLSKLLEDPKVVDKLAQGRLPGSAAGLDLLLLPLRDAVRLRGVRGGLSVCDQ